MMKSLLILCGLVALCRGQGYNYNAPIATTFSGSGIDVRAGSGGYASGSGVGSSGFGVGVSGGNFGVSGGSLGLSGGSLGLSGGGLGVSGFGVSGGGSGSFKQGQTFNTGYANQAPVIHKHVYVHVAPEEPEEVRQRTIPQVAAPQKHYKIIFIKTPSAPAYVNPVIPLQPQNQEKTLVYVLVKKPEEQQDVVIPTAAPTQPSKPEVYFIKYSAKKTAGGGVGGAVGGGILGGAIGGDVLSGGSIGTFADSDSISVSGFKSGGGASTGSLAPKYGPPGYAN